MYKFFYAVSPKRYRTWIEKHINYCDFTVSPINLIGFLTLFGLLLGFSLGFILYVFNIVGVQGFIIAWATTFILFEILGHLTLVFIADSRANFVQEILPDALQIISANIRSGLTTDKAILTSARPEFGPLEKELRKAAKETLSGKSIEEALRGISVKIKSKILDKTIGLIIEGLSKGGSLTSLFDSIADDTRQARILRSEIKSYVMMYGIFIFFAAGIGAPLLYSVATYLVETMTRIGGAVNMESLVGSVSGTSISVLTFKATSITPGFLRMYSYLAILVTTFFGSMLIGLVQEGSEKAGLRFFPVLLGIAFAVFTLSNLALKSIFGALVA